MRKRLPNPAEASEANVSFMGGVFFFLFFPLKLQIAVAASNEYCTLEPAERYGKQ